MRFMILVKATAESEAGVIPTDGELMAEMVAYHEELAKAGLLIDGSGLHPSSRGWRIRYDGSETTVVDGPFAETKELIAGYTLIRASSREEAMEWTRRFPNPIARGAPCEVEVRQLFDIDEFGEGPSVDLLRKLISTEGEERS